MKTGHASKTAEAAAAIRANHYLNNTNPVFSDPYAWKMTSSGWRTLLSNPLFMKAFNSRLFNRSFGLLTAQVTGRSIYAEDWLSEAIELGIQQYVIIGAGLDSFVLRQAALYPKLKIYELDHPDTQALKINKLRHLGKIPNNVEFVPIDFENEAITTALQHSSFESKQTSFFSWLGTTHYLKPEITLATLQNIASYAAPNSELVLDYSLDYTTLKGIERVGVLALSKFTHILNEPIVGALNTEHLHQALFQMGYIVLEDLSGKEITERYFHQRADGIQHTQATHLLRIMIT